ncbi:MAG TPA: S-layer homology domain-containing protein [Thermoanaerobaculia bacterium]|jgi:hypothetical protein|nr:S-layer homology domain-containing protein [Thermoanaerobaculia bacterium]
MNDNRKALFSALFPVALGMLLVLSGPAPAAAGNLAVQSGSKYSGNYGLQVTPDSTAAFVQSSHPSSEKAYRVRFYVNLTRLELASNSDFDLFAAYSGADPAPTAAPTGNPVLRASVRQQSDGTKVLDLFTWTDSGEVQSSSSPQLRDGWHAVELQWSGATAAGANNGSVNLWVDGQPRTTGLAGLDSDTQVINYARWGSVSGASTASPPPGVAVNTFKVDEFSSQRSGYIGQVQVFTDVPATDPLFRFIQGLYAAEVTAGCGNGTTYCPGDNVTRDQMAVFLERGSRGALFTPPAASGIFADVPAGSFFAPFIEQLFRDGVTAGCATSPPQYCPSSPVMRDQMAVFLLRAKYGPSYTPPPATGTVFNDVPANAFAAAFIERLAAEGISTGCGGGSYCPHSPVTRAQMAVFLVRTFSFPTQDVGP